MDEREAADHPASLPHGERRVRSFVLRQGRTTPAQEQAFERYWARFGVDYSGSLRDPAVLFAQTAPLVLEIGFGNGAQLLHAAVHEAQRNFIGIEVHRPGVGRLMNGLAEAGVDNARLYRHDAVEVLANELPPDSLDEVRIYFPDPWPKKRHHKRRLLQPAFVDLVASRVRHGGLLHLATDWAEYAQQMLEVMDASPRWRNLAGQGKWSPRPAWRIDTHFERRGLRLGHGVYDLLHART